MESYFKITDINQAIYDTIDDNQRLQCLILSLSPDANPLSSPERHTIEVARGDRMEVRQLVSWLRLSQKIAVKVLLQMKEEGLTQKALAERMDCTQQYVSKILKGRENMSLDTLSKLEDALGISLIYDEQVASPSMVAEEVLA